MESIRYNVTWIESMAISISSSGGKNASERERAVFKAV